MGTRPFTERGIISPQSTRAVAIAAIALVAGCLAPAAQAAPRTASATGKVIALRPLSFFRVQDLDFGSIIPGTTAGVVRIQPDGTRTATGGVVLVGTGFQPARFAGLGSNNQQVNISLGSNTIQLTGPGAPMTVSQFEIGSTPTAVLSTSPTRFRITSAGGNFNFPVGARLAVNANQAAGNYSGTFTITLNYL